MPKKTSASRKSGKNHTARGNHASNRRYPSTVGTVSKPLPIVGHGSGRSLRLRARLGMNRETFARLVPISTRGLADIEAGKHPSAKALRHLQELRRVVDALAEVIQKDAIGPWLQQPNSAFDGLKPIEVIERGEVDRIWEMIFYLRSGISS